MTRSITLIALAAPFLLGAALPPERPAISRENGGVVQVNVIDRFLKDTGIRKQPAPSQRSKNRMRSTRSSIPKPPPLASVPLPLPRPAETAKAVTSTPPAPVTEAPNTPAKNETTTSAPLETAAPSTAQANDHGVTKPPVIKQPATADEPARETEVPKPLPKPETDTADDKSDIPTKQEYTAETQAGDQPAQAETKPDAKKVEQGGTEKAETPPPPPLVKEDPQELQACLADLKAIGATFEPTDPINEGNGCGIENPIDVRQVLPGVDLGGATMRCKTALTMAHWLKDTVQPAMNIAMPGRKIVGLVPGSTYQCRLRNSAATGKISEHARGNAYDVAAFKLDNGEKIEMKPRTEDSTLEGAFRRTATAGACLHFTTVLSPGSDEAHEDHLHLDILERNGGYRYCR